MRAIGRRLWGWVAAVFRWRVRIPLFRPRIPLGIILAVLVVVFGGAGIAMHETSRPIFCLSCHEMGTPVETWRLSSHKDVACSKCHIMPGYVNMFKSKVTALRQVYLHIKGPVESSAIRAHVPDTNCKACHPKTRNLIVYHDLQVTHKAHWDRGIECTVCHGDVVHGPQAASVNTPRMATCFKCHNGKQAPNTCSTCHIVLGNRGPTTFTPEWVEAHKENIRTESGEACRRCHQQDFCNNCHRSAMPHPPNWLVNHPQAYAKDSKSCRVCHALPTEQKGEMAFCRDCHQIRRAHALNWLSVHQDAFRRNPNECSRCHEQKFCSDCHAIYQQHPTNWLQIHPGAATANPQGCRTCHTQEFCDRCHSKTVPKTHTTQWPQTHGAAVSAGAAGCSACHKPGFCQACHASRAGKPKSHDALWLKRHGPSAVISQTACDTCHAASFCDSCHGGMKMPHPQDWLQAHRATAARDSKVCARCHDQSFCNACHRATVPTSHQDGWIGRHGAQAKANRKLCANCHTGNLCDSCHRGLTMPHPSDWPAAHGAQAKAAKDRQRCAACHSADFCASCHGLDMPHPSGWVQKHGAAATASSKTCMRCHGPKATGVAAKKAPCSSCHESLPPSSHGAKDWLSEQHVVAGSDKPDLCTLCHGENSCDRCHAKRGVK